MEDNQLVQKILQDYKSELMGYKTNLRKFKRKYIHKNIILKKTKHLSKRVSVQCIHYFSEITKQCQ